MTKTPFEITTPIDKSNSNPDASLAPSVMPLDGLGGSSRSASKFVYSFGVGGGYVTYGNKYPQVEPVVNQYYSGFWKKLPAKLGYGPHIQIEPAFRLWSAPNNNFSISLNAPIDLGITIFEGLGVAASTSIPLLLDLNFFGGSTARSIKYNGFYIGAGGALNKSALYAATETKKLPTLYTFESTIGYKFSGLQITRYIGIRYGQGANGISNLSVTAGIAYAF